MNIPKSDSVHRERVSPVLSEEKPGSIMFDPSCTYYCLGPCHTFSAPGLNLC